MRYKMGKDSEAEGKVAQVLLPAQVSTPSPAPFLLQPQQKALSGFLPGTGDLTDTCVHMCRWRKC